MWSFYFSLIVYAGSLCFWRYEQCNSKMKRNERGFREFFWQTSATSEAFWRGTILQTAKNKDSLIDKEEVDRGDKVNRNFAAWRPKGQCRTLFVLSPHKSYQGQAKVATRIQNRLVLWFDHYVNDNHITFQWISQSSVLATRNSPLLQ